MHAGIHLSVPLKGAATVGQSLNVFIKPPGAGGMRFHPTVLVVTHGREFRWKGKLLVPGLFDGEHYFKLEPQPEGGLIFHQGEQFSGMLVSLFKKSLDGATRQGFVAMNEAVKLEAEKK